MKQDSRGVDIRRLNLQALIESQGHLSGRWSVDQLPRLLSSLATGPGPDVQVAWAIQGECRPMPGEAPQWWLRVCADAEVALVCQRCLSPVREHVVVDRWVRFVADEALAEALDAELEDDVLALPRHLDLIELMEDELLLALPLVPRHAVCPQPLSTPALDAPGDEAPHPFAALAALKKSGAG